MRGRRTVHGPWLRASWPGAMDWYGAPRSPTAWECRSASTTHGEPNPGALPVSGPQTVSKVHSHVIAPCWRVFFLFFCVTSLLRKTTVPYKGACSTQRQREEPRPRVTSETWHVRHYFRQRVFVPGRGGFTRVAPSPAASWCRLGKIGRGHSRHHDLRRRTGERG